MNLIPCMDMTVDKAYVITVLNNDISESLSNRCVESCNSVGMLVEKWPAFNGTSGNIVAPDHCVSSDWVNWIKLYDLELSVTEVACVLSHISLWAHCVTINKPIVILEHDAIMVRPYTNHLGYNTIGYLGCIEQAHHGWKVTPTSPQAAKNEHYRYMLRAHAYAVDPFVARNLLAYFIKYGICESLDISIRADQFSIIQPGLYAYDLPHEQTTITNRKKKSDGSER